MALPTSRNTTYAADSVIRSADLNDIQDKIIDLDAFRHSASRVLNIPSSMAQRRVATEVEEWEQQTGYCTNTILDGYLYVPIPLHVGDRITAASVWVFGKLTPHNITVKLFRSTPVENAVSVVLTETQIGSTVQSAYVADIQEIAITSITPYTLVANTFLWIELRGTSTLMAFYGAKITYDHP